MESKPAAIVVCLGSILSIRRSYFITCEQGITVRALVMGNEGSQAFGVFDPGLPDMRWDSILLEGFAEDLQPSGELTSHNGMLAMCFRQWTALVLDVRSQEPGRELKLHLFDAVAIRLAEEKPDHEVVEKTIDESIKDLLQTLFTELIIEGQGDTPIGSP